MQVVPVVRHGNTMSAIGSVDVGTETRVTATIDDGTRATHVIVRSLNPDAGHDDRHTKLR